MTAKSKLASVCGVIGKSCYGNKRQSEDFYSTGEGAISLLENIYTLPKKVWECACGNGCLSEQLKDNGHTVYSTELYARGYGKTGVDFLKTKKMPAGYDCICTNPPFSLGVDFCKHALKLTSDKGVVAMFLKLAFLESQARYDGLFYDNPPTYVMPFVKRITCYKNDDRKTNSAMIPFAWFVWDKKVKSKAPQIYWI